ncbi:unnamed protein product [Linum trigynum]|uniref:Uncharacterized protein n=1 Tax=Linum trigynum TaxID=586398 RepID=A0AAV2CF36_9ROSI
MVNIRNHKHTIMKLIKDDNTEVTYVKEMGDEAVRFYKNLLGEVDKEVQILPAAVEEEVRLRRCPNFVDSSYKGGEQGGV